MTDDDTTTTAGGSPLDGGVRRLDPKRAGLRVACILEQAAYKPGDQAPEGYLAWHEWAEAQHKAGLRQKQCGRCGLWRYPQQLSGIVDRAELSGMRKRKPTRVTVETPVCNDCNKPPNVRAKRATTAGRQARAGENVRSTTGPGLVACRWRSA